MDYSLFEQLAINGVLLGLVYGLVGLGLSVVLGVMGIVNISHGALYMLGGYVAFVVSEQMKLPPIISVCAAVGIIFVVGVFIDRGIVNTVRNDQTSVMMITFGLAIILGSVVLVLTKGNPFTSVPVTRSVLVVPHTLLYAPDEFVVAAISGVAIAVLTILFLNKSKTGKAMRMVSQNKETANILGVSTWKISVISLGLGSSYAGLAGALLTPVYPDSPGAQWGVLVAAFVVVIVGGLGSVTGSMIGGLIYGIVETIGSFYFPSSSDILVLVLIILIILVRPSGLFGIKERV